MSSSYQEKYNIVYYRAQSAKASLLNDFAPSRQSLRAAHDIVRRSEKRRRAAAKLSRHSRVAVTSHSPALSVPVSDNIIAFNGPVWARPSSSPVYSRPRSSPYALSPAPHARRASLQRQARRLSRHVRASTSWSAAALGPGIIDGVEKEALEHFGVMAVQALVVILGMGALLALLTLL